MDSTEKRPRNAATKILAASNALQRTLSEVKEENPELTGISVRVGVRAEEHEAAEESGSRLVITIDANTQEEAEFHGNQLQDQGCYCSSSGPTQVTCDCSDAG